jgi:para-aminobenzoate synthetase component 1
MCKKITGSIDLDLLNQFFAALPNPVILGGNTAKENADGFSYWAAKPVEIFKFWTEDKNPFGKLQRALNKYKLARGDSDNLPEGIFIGGWIGYFGYELARFIERLPDNAVDDLQLPLIRLCFYDRFIAYDHIRKECLLIALQLQPDDKTVEEKIAGLERDLNRSQGLTIKEPKEAQFSEPDFSKISCNMDKQFYLRAVEKIKRYIFDGDVYQVNFSQRFECDYEAAPLDLFCWQNRFNPCGFSAYIDGGDFAIVSASPEMFLTIKNGIISTKPIKGTRPRVGDEAAGKKINERNCRELDDSPKEQAELNMIIDLERNDLARICVPGSRKVIQPRTIEVYPTVFHAVATVEGLLRSDVNFCDCLRAVFPGGSITGAPKVAAMKIIDQLEPTQRGIYTGSIGFIGLDGNVCLNIAIRTIIIKGKKAFVQTGGGIVADSNPEDEWQETLTKAGALIAGIRACGKK